jgi:hypothetical protein
MAEGNEPCTIFWFRVENPTSGAGRVSYFLILIIIFHIFFKRETYTLKFHEPAHSLLKQFFFRGSTSVPTRR